MPTQSDDEFCYLRETHTERTAISDVDDVYADRDVTNYFHRVRGRAIADSLVALFDRRFSDHPIPNRSRRGPSRFSFVAASGMGDAEKVLADEVIDELSSVVDAYCAQMTYEGLELQSDGIFPDYDTGDPPLYGEGDPLSPESLYHQAEKWTMRLTPVPQMSGDDFKRVLFWRDMDGKLSMAENFERMKAAEAERARKVASLAAESGTSELSPFDSALLRLLETLPATWSAMEFSKFSHAEEKAFDRLVEAGLVQARVEAVASMEGFPHRVRLRCRVTGDFNRKLADETVRSVPDSLTEDGKLRAKCSYSFRVLDARLTDQGELAKRDWESPSPSFVLVFVRGRGPGGAGATKAKGVVRVEERHVDEQPEGAEHARRHKTLRDPKIARPADPQPTRRRSSDGASALTPPTVSDSDTGEGEAAVPKTAPFDVFLSHNSADKPTVRALAKALKQRELRVWLDEWELVPGRPWQEGLEKIIGSVRSAAVLVGSDGLGPWEEPEMRTCLTQFVKRRSPVIPVLMPGAPKEPALPLFLAELTWVDLRGGLTDEGLDRLQWGITGKKP